MTFLTEMMQHPLDPGYAAAAESRRKTGLPPATGHRSPMLVVMALLIGALLATSALSLRAPETSAIKVKAYLVSRIEAMRAHVETQTGLIATLRSEIDTALKARPDALMLNGYTPDLTIILDAPETIAQARLAARATTPDRYERFDAGFAARVSAGYRAIAAAEPARCALIDAAGSVETVAALIAAIVRQRLGQ